MKLNRTCGAALLLAASLAAPIYAQDGTAPDNSKVNKQDRNTGAVTADQQKMNTGDRDLTKKIRQAVMADKSLSTYAHNVKIVSQNGTVTLRGPVRSDAEKATIENKAIETAGSRDNVKNEITVKK